MTVKNPTWPRSLDSLYMYKWFCEYKSKKLSEHSALFFVFVFSHRYLAPKKGRQNVDKLTKFNVLMKIMWYDQKLQDSY